MSTFSVFRKQITFIMMALVLGISLETHSGETSHSTVSIGHYKMMVAKLSLKKAREIDLMARTIYGEARGEGSDKALEAVAHVILNRVKDINGKWPNSISEVVLQNKQFSCWNKQDPNYTVVTEVNFNNPEFRRAYFAAFKALKGKDITNGANHYHTLQVRPKWSNRSDMVRVAQINKHIFYRS